MALLTHTHTKQSPLRCVSPAPRTVTITCVWKLWESNRFRMCWILSKRYRWISISMNPFKRGLILSHFETFNYVGLLTKRRIIWIVHRFSELLESAKMIPTNWLVSTGQWIVSTNGIVSIKLSWFFTFWVEPTALNQCFKEPGHINFESIHNIIESAEKWCCPRCEYLQKTVLLLYLRWDLCPVMF